MFTYLSPSVERILGYAQDELMTHYGALYSAHPDNEAALDTVHGRYEIFWAIDEAQFQLVVSIPAGCSATVVMPDGATHEVAAGDHTFTQALQTSDGIPVLREVTELAS